MPDTTNSEAPTVEVDEDFVEAHGLLGLALAAELDENVDGDEEELELVEGDVVGRYTLIEQIGKGGFGIVWKAQQNDVLKREVALKIIRAGMNSRSVIVRFRRERQALALMSHKGISTVLDAGTTPNHRPYFAMELLKGLAINKYAREHELTARQCLELMLDVCKAVQHAHQKGVLHRDLKPSNIIVVTEDGKPTPKIIDFGIAKVLHAESQDAETLSFTARGIMLGTPAYMAPEHATLGSDQVDVRADVYSLGAILYEMLTRCQPFDLVDETKLTPAEMFRRMCTSEAVRPSVRIVKRMSFGESSLRHARLLQGEIDWLVLRALEKNPEDRYPSVTAMAEDIERYLSDEPLSVGPPGAWYRFRKLAARHRAAFVLGCTIVLSVTAIAVLSTWALQVEHKALAEAEANRQRAEQSENVALEQNQKAGHLITYLNQLLASAGKHVDEGKNPEALRLALDESAEKLDNLEAQPDVQITLCESLANVYLAMGDSAHALPLLMRQQALCARLYGEDDPRTLRIHMPIARAEIDVRGDHTSALQRLQKAADGLENSKTKQVRDYFEAMRALATELSLQNMHKEALEAIQRLSSQRNGRNEPALEDPSFVRAVAEIQRRAGALGDAQQTLLEALEKLPPSVKSKREQATRSRFLQSLARVKLDLKDRKAASMYLTEAATMERLSHGNSSKLVDLLIENARLIGEEHQPEQALADLKTALTMARKAGDLGQQIHVLRATGDVLDSAGRKAEALPVREECERLGREYANTIVTWLDDLNALATLLNDLGRTDEAMDKALSMWTRLQEETDFTTGDHSKLERIYSGLIKITESFQQKKGTHDRDQLVAEWKRRRKALDEPVP